MKKKQQKRLVKVKDMPATWILVNSKLSDEEIKNNWLEKYKRLNLSPLVRRIEIGVALKKRYALKEKRDDIERHKIR